MKLRFLIWAILGAAVLWSYTLRSEGKTPDPYAAEIKALQAQAKAELKAANKEVAAERKARTKACDKAYAARGQQLDVQGRLTCQ